VADEFVEIPVTRRARVTRIGVLSYDGLLYVKMDPGEQLIRGESIVCKAPGVGGSFRPGVGRVTDAGGVMIAGIAGASEGDFVYRVEPAAA
jgi:hypothetical protein